MITVYDENKEPVNISFEAERLKLVTYIEDTKYKVLDEELVNIKKKILLHNAELALYAETAEVVYNEITKTKYPGGRSDLYYFEQKEGWKIDWTAEADKKTIGQDKYSCGRAVTGVQRTYRLTKEGISMTAKLNYAGDWACSKYLEPLETECYGYITDVEKRVSEFAELENKITELSDEIDVLIKRQKKLMEKKEAELEKVGTVTENKKAICNKYLRG